MVPWKWIVTSVKSAFVVTLAFFYLLCAYPALAEESNEHSYDKIYQLSLNSGASFGSQNESFAVPEFYYANHDLFGMNWDADVVLDIYHLDLMILTRRVAHTKWSIGSGAEIRRFKIRDGDLVDGEFEKNDEYEGLVLNKRMLAGREIHDRFYMYLAYDGRTYYNPSSSKNEEDYQVPEDFNLHELILFGTYEKLSYDEHREVDYGYSAKISASYGFWEEGFTYGLPEEKRRQQEGIIRYGGSLRLYMMLFGPETINLFIEGESMEGSIEAYRADRYLAENYISTKLSCSPRIGEKSRITPHIKFDYMSLSGDSGFYFGLGFKVSHYFNKKASMEISYEYDQNRWTPTIYNTTEKGEHTTMAIFVYKWFK